MRRSESPERMAVARKRPLQHLSQNFRYPCPISTVAAVKSKTSASF